MRQLDIKTLRVEEIHADPANLRQHPPESIAAIKASFQRFGLQKPLVIEAKGIVRAGKASRRRARSTAATASIVGEAMVRFEARTGRRAWTYTHAWKFVPIDAWKGARVMASCETLEHIREAAERGYAAAIVVPEYLNGDRAYSEGDAKIVPCPFETRGVTCDKCRLCMRPEGLKAAGAVIAFKSHATKAKRVNEVVRKAEATAMI